MDFGTSSATARFARAPRGLRLLPLAILCGGLLAGCETRTSQPMCDASNATRLLGLEGIWTLSFPGENFETQTSEMEITGPETYDALGGRARSPAYRVSLRGVSAQASGAHPKFAFDGLFTTCQIDGRTLAETKNEDGLGFSQQVVTLTPASLSFQTLTFDKNVLAAAGIPHEVVKVALPDEGFLKLPSLVLPVGPRAVPSLDDDPVKTKDVLIIDNFTVPRTELWKAARIVGAGMIYSRK